VIVAFRRLGAFALVALGAVYVAWRGFGVQTMGDYPHLFAPATDALLAGHLGAFFHQLPPDGAGGSVILRAPGALLGKVLGGTELARFRFGALESVLALGGLGLWLARGMRLAGRGPAVRVGVVGLCVLAPTVLDAILFGHPEEPLGAALCVGAVLLADAELPVLAGLALGLAIANKPWGILAVAPALLATRYGRRRIASVAGAIVATWFAASYLAAPGDFARSFSMGVFSVVAHPEELWWPLARAVAPHGVAPYYTLPGLLARHGRELVLPVAACLAYLLARRPERTADDCLALLALLFLVRCLLDPADHIYYHVPFVVALVAWEARARGAPVLALLATGLLWSVFHTVSGVGSLDVQFVAYFAVVVPLAAILLGAAVGRAATGRPGLTARTAAAQ
jgi:hypothetical protein